MPDLAAQTNSQTGVAPAFDLAQQSKSVNDVLGIATVCIVVICACLFLFRRMGRTARGGGCAGCSSGGCPIRGQGDGAGCQPFSGQDKREA